MKLHQTIIALSLASSSFLCMGMNKTVDPDGFITRTPKSSAKKQQTNTMPVEQETKTIKTKLSEKNELKKQTASFEKQFGYPIPTEYNLTAERKARLAQKRQEASTTEEVQKEVTSNISSAQKTDVLNALYLQFNAQSPAPRHVKNALKQESINQDIDTLYYTINPNVRCTYDLGTNKLTIFANNCASSSC